MRCKRAPISGTTRSDGFTIAELMVSLVIMVIVASQLTLILLTQNRVYAEQKRVLSAQEDARLVAEIIAADLRAAGFLVPHSVGISSRDGGTTGSDAICVSDPARIADSKVEDATRFFDRVQVTDDLATSSSEVEIDSFDIDQDGNNDFFAGAGIIISDGTSSHCARIEAVDVGNHKIQFAPSTPAADFSVASGSGRATPALIYEVSSSGLLRNGSLLSPRVENLQIQYAIDVDGNGMIEDDEFPIDDLEGNDASQIFGVQLSVITRSSQLDPQFSGLGMPKSANHLGAAADGYRRRVVTVNVAPRNL
jgi:prepilin-type N-terminal cleavage/methylation domain-containing protein